MSFFERLNRVVQANLDDTVSESINPKEALEQAIREIQKAIVEIKQAITRIDSVPNKQAQLNYIAATTEAQKWRRLFEVADAQFDEKQASYALERLKIHEGNARQAQALIDKNTNQADDLKDNLVVLEKKLAEAIKKRAIIIGYDIAKKMAALEVGSDIDIDEELRILKEELKRSSEQPCEPQEIATEEATSNIKDERPDIIDITPSPSKPQELLAIEKAIQETRNAIVKAKEVKSQLQNQYLQTKIEADTFHKQALKAIENENQTAATRALINEATQKKLIDAFKSQLEDQEVVVNLLEGNLTALEQVENTVKKLFGVVDISVEVDSLNF